MVVFAPASVQEAVELTQEAFDVADVYRNPVMILGDGMLGQMMEPVEMKRITPREVPEKTWATDGKTGRPRNIINSLYIDPAVLEAHNEKLEKKYAQMALNEVRVASVNVEGADAVIVAYGTMARIAQKACAEYEKQYGKKIGLVRPITLWPFPSEAVAQAAAQDSVKKLLSIEMSTGQMVDDVRLAVNGAKPVEFYGRAGGMVPTVSDCIGYIHKALEGDK
jgi:2-oxoglutarate ferredoxin oxidoreductase subunit alpha